MRYRPLFWSALAAVVLFTAACHTNPSSTSSVRRVRLSPKGKGDGAAGENGKRVSTAMAFELHPVIHVVGQPGARFDRVEFDIGYPILRGKTPAQIKVTPSLPGKVVKLLPQRFAFVPQNPPALDTSYRFEVTSVATTRGELQPKEAVVETHTPAFAFLGADLAEKMEKVGRVRVWLRYSAAPRLADVQRALHVTVDGKANRFTVEKSKLPTVLELAIDRADGASQVVIDQAAGVGSAESTKALGSNHSELAVPSSVVDVKLVQGGALGPRRYIEVLCKDPQEKAIDLYSPSYQEVSERCLPENIDAISVEPALKSTTVAQIRGGFRIFGNFDRGSYTVRLPSKLRTAKESGFMGDGVYPVSFGALDASASIIGRGRYLPPEAWQSLGLRTRNALEATITVRRIPATNMSFWMSDSSESATARNSDIIAEGKLDVTGPLDGEQVTYVDLDDLVKGSARQPGVYEIAVNAGMGDSAADENDDEKKVVTDEEHGDDGDDGSGDDSGRERAPKTAASDARRFLYTHLNLVAKRETDQSVQVWAFDLDSLAPVSGVELTSVVPSGRVVSRCVTGGQGSCRLLPLPKETVDRTAPIAVVARRGDDTSYLRFSDLEITPTTSVGGPPYAAARDITAVTYADRGVYRPGETAHVVVVVRDKKMHAPAQAATIAAHLFDPKTRVVRKYSATANGAGAVAFDVPFSADADTGSYELRLFDAAHDPKRSDPIGSHTIQVEEFVPERMNAEVALAKSGDHRLGEAVGFRVSARYLFGGSAEGAAYKLHCALDSGTFSAEKFSDFSFTPLGLGIGSAHKKDAIPVDDIDGKLGPGGVDKAVCKGIEAGDDLNGPRTLTASLSVMEAGSGRATTAEHSTTLHPANFYLGVKASATSLTAAQPVSITGVVVDWTGELKPQNRDATVELLQLQRNVYWSRGDDDDASRADYAAAYSESKQKVSLKDGHFAVTLNPGDAHADYLVRVRSGRALTEILLSGSGSDWDDWYFSSTNDSTPRPERPSAVKIDVGTAPLKVGQDFAVQFDSRFAGRALISVETDHITKSEWLDLKAGRNDWSFRVDGFVPNVYLSVLGFKNPHQESAEAFLPERAFGVVAVPVDFSEKRHALTVHAPTEIRSGAPLDVTLDIAGGSSSDQPVFATVAAVDEGILKLTKFASPDPLAELFAQRALGVSTFETVGWNVAAPSLTKQIGGGDDDEGGGGGSHAQPIKPVALWSGLVAVDANGHATVHFNVPTYRGQLRVMAVTIGAEKLGAASAEVLVRDPVVVQTTLPRFLVKDDRAEVPVFLSNVSKETRNVDVEMTAEPLDAGDSGPVAVEIAAVGAHTLKLPVGKSGTVKFTVVGKAIGDVRIKVKATAGELVVGEELELGVSAGLPKIQKVAQIALGKSGGKTPLDAALIGDWQDGTDRTTLRVVTNPYAQALLGMDQLLGYPYGCIEQTTSATRPLLAARRLLEEIPPKLPPGQSIEQRLTAGIARIFSMQTPAGGFAYWPGSSEPNLWGTAYATHLLLDAKAAHVDFQTSRLDDALEFLERSADGRYSWQEYYRWGDQRAEPYVQYVLARAGRGHAARITELLGYIDRAREYAYRANVELTKLRNSSSLASMTLPYEWLDVSSLDEDSFLLKAALYLTGDKRYAADLQKMDLRPIYFLRQYSWSFYSDMRFRGLALAIYGDLFGATAQAKPAVDLLVDTISHHPYNFFNTQELGWALTAIAGQVGPSPGKIDAHLFVGDSERTAQRATAGAAPTFTVRGLSRATDANVTVAGAGSPRYLLAITEGVPSRAEDVPLGAHGIILEREYLDAKGDTIDPAHVALGAVVYVKLSLHNAEGRSLANLALVDRLPAGFEIENPRLGRGNDQLPWLSSASLKPWSLDFMNLRDDRYEAFGTLGWKQSATLVYAVRATSAGTFSAPSAQIEAMYDPSVWGRTDLQSITVEAP